MRLYLRGKWPEADVPEGCPLILYYEVDPADDVVLRAIEIFADGHAERNSVALESRDGFPCMSIVHGPFMPSAEEAHLELLPQAEFEALWQQSSDKPVES